MTSAPRSNNLDKTMRVNLASTRAAWARVDGNLTERAESPPRLFHTPDGDFKEQSIQEWLDTGCTLEANEDRPQSPDQRDTLRRLGSAEDDLMLGVEANMYQTGIQGLSVQEYLRTLRTASETRTLSRWNSLSSTTTTVNSGPRSIVELLNLYEDDPEEFLLDLGFGKEEPDMLHKIPARFLNNPSEANGINMEVFHEAQKLRIDLECQDVYSRFKLKFLQRVTDAFFSFHTSQSQFKENVSKERKQHVETREKYRRFVMLLRKAAQRNRLENTEDSIYIKENYEEGGKFSGATKHSGLQCTQLSIPEKSITPMLTWEQNTGKRRCTRLREAKDIRILELSTKRHVLQESQYSESLANKLELCKGDQLPDSFEMEEIQSIDEEIPARMALKSTYIEDIKRGNSCQSDSSGFLEEPFIPLSLQAPRPQNISDDSIERQATLQKSRKQSILRQDTEHKTDSFTKSSNDNNCTHSVGSHLVSPIFQEENKSDIENENEDKPSEESIMETSRFLDGSSCTDTSQSLAPDNISHLNTRVRVQSNDSQCQNEYSAMIKGKTPATENNTISGPSEATQLLPDCVSGLSNFITIQIPQGMSQQKCFTKLHSLESLPVSYQHANKDTALESENIFVGSRKSKTREVSVQTDEGYPVKENQSPNNCSSFKSEFQFRKSFRKSFSLDTGLHHLDSHLQEHVQTPATHCCCHHCCCPHHYCSPSWHNETKVSLKAGTSHLEGYLLNTLEELQQAVKMISAFPLAVQEIVTTKQFLQHFQNRLLDIEQRITEQQALVYSILSEDEREEMKRLGKLHQEVHNEITELEVQLEDRARQVGEGMRMQLQTLLVEQSLFYSSLEKPKKVSEMTSESYAESSPSGRNSTTSLRPNFTSVSLLPSQDPGSSAVAGHSEVNSISPSTTLKASTEITTTAKPNMESSSSQQNKQPETLGIQAILQNIKHSFNQLWQSGSDRNGNVSH